MCEVLKRYPKHVFHKLVYFLSVHLVFLLHQCCIYLYHYVFLLLTPYHHHLDRALPVYTFILVFLPLFRCFMQCTLLCFDSLHTGNFGPHLSDPFIHLQRRVPQPVLHLHPLVRYSTVLWTCFFRVPHYLKLLFFSLPSIAGQVCRKHAYITHTCMYIIWPYMCYVTVYIPIVLGCMYMYVYSPGMCITLSSAFLQ